MTRTVLVAVLMTAAMAACQFAYSVDSSGADAGSGSGSADAGTGDGAVPFTRCGFQGYDDPLRYATAYSSAALTWTDARALCVRRGMDLAVMNDARELGAVEADDWPAWIGISEASASAPWVAVDGCPAMQPPGATVGPACASVQVADAIAPSTCDATGAITRALCETPRPDSAACLRDPAGEHYAASPTPLAYADAVTYCTGMQMHLVVIDSHAELAQLETNMPPADFWIGERWDGAAWHAETACPGEMTWADGGASTASLGSAPSCTAETVAMGPADDPDNPPVLGLRGQTLVACDAPKLALCESD